jgi:hypothetical protein
VDSDLLALDPDCVSRSGSRRAKMTHKTRNFFKKSCFEALYVLFLGLKASSYSLDVLGGLGISKLQFLINFRSSKP